MLENLKTDNSIQEEKDTLGGSYILESDVYDFAIEMAYFDKSKGGAMSLTLHMRDMEGSTMRETLWVTSGTAKGCKNYYEDAKGNKRYLPGFNTANSIAVLALDKELAAVETEPKMVNIYDFTQGKEVPQERDVLVPLIGAEISIGVMKSIEDKNAQNAQGQWVASGETKEENHIDKVFRTSDGLTIAEKNAESTESVFKDKWLDKNKGVVRNNAKGERDSSLPATEGQTAATSGNSEATSLFQQNA